MEEDLNSPKAKDVGDTAGGDATGEIAKSGENGSNPGTGNPESSTVTGDEVEKEEEPTVPAPPVHPS